MYRYCTCTIAVQFARWQFVTCTTDLLTININVTACCFACLSCMARLEPSSQFRRPSHLRELLSQHSSHFARQLYALFVIQLISLASPKHGPAPALDLGSRLWPRYDVEMNMRNDLCCSRTVVLNNVPVGHTSDLGDDPREYGQPKTWVSILSAINFVLKSEAYRPISFPSSAVISPTLTL